MQPNTSPTPCPEGTRRCHVCKQLKPIEQFSRHAKKPLGYGYACLACNRERQRDWRQKNPDAHRADVAAWRKYNPDKVAQYARNWRTRNPEKARANNLRDNQGITQKQYDDMHEAQNGCCKICGTNKSTGRGKKLEVDHCHRSLQIRGLLCHRCNTGLGYFKDDPAILQSAIAYLAEGGVKR